MTDQDQDRIRRLEERVSALEARLEGAGPVSGADSPPRADPSADADTSPAVPDPETFWVLDGLARRFPADGAVVFAGRLDLPGSGHVMWQYGRLADDLLADRWDELASSLGALAHPVRLRLLRAVLNGAHSTTALLSELDGGTSGQLYHHLHPLVAAGWLSSTGRGRYGVPAERVVPLLALVSAAEAPA
ncbi:helix-turn-helix protein [Mumia flava]|uniref:Helix-turn-helix protein n=1 Tax=Mumia flava TaxID=1348852 RepID=A0A0B2BRK9_9ACTN|nr:helix-turn-helix domain-containing protein [Mumia flava]PJJ56882.1 helix-turn-helix protein [Mumia flava]